VPSALPGDAEYGTDSVVRGEGHVTEEGDVHHLERLLDEVERCTSQQVEHRVFATGARPEAHGFAEGNRAVVLEPCCAPVPPRIRILSLQVVLPTAPGLLCDTLALGHRAEAVELLRRGCGVEVSAEPGV
jgi:hypothetical protein